MWSKWYLVKTKHGDSKAVIRRYRKLNGKTKWERYPAEKYSMMTMQDIEALVRRLNVTEELKRKEAEERYNFDHSFVKQTIVEGFEKVISNNSSRQQHVVGLIRFLNKYVLDFFINKKKLPHPNFWTQKEEDWGAWLLSQKLAPSTLKQIVQVANRFLKYMYKKYPGEVQAIILEPFSKKKLADLQARLPSVDRKKLVIDEHYQLMLKECHPDLVPYIKMGYQFGLRVAEIYGCTTDHVFKGYLHVTRQVVKVEPRVSYGPLKNKQVRKVPYWFATPKEAYEQISSLRRLHPNTVSDFFGRDMARLKLPYEFHDLRRTFITKALRTNHWRDVQLAAGHYDIKTTIQYAQDDRTMDDEKYVP